MPRTEVSRGGGALVRIRADEPDADFSCLMSRQRLRRHSARVVYDYDLTITPREFDLPYRTKAQSQLVDSVMGGDDY
jgi:hypothetical protein